MIIWGENHEWKYTKCSRVNLNSNFITLIFIISISKSLANQSIQTKNFLEDFQNNTQSMVKFLNIQLVFVQLGETQVQLDCFNWCCQLRDMKFTISLIFWLFVKLYLIISIKQRYSHTLLCYQTEPTLQKFKTSLKLFP